MLVKPRSVVSLVFIYLFSLSLLWAAIFTRHAMASELNHWFEDFKANASDEALYRLLYAMPKGGDLHNHLSGSNYSQWWEALASDPSKNGGYQYYVKTTLKHCNGYGLNQFGPSSSLLLFVTIQASTYEALTSCEQAEYNPVQSLTHMQKEAWLNGIWLDKPHEGREEFFQTHWQRLNQLNNNPYIAAEMLFKNMQSFADEGLLYLETQANASNFLRSDGTAIPMQEVANIYRNRLAQQDAIDTGLTVRLQHVFLRFSPNAEQALTQSYQFVDKNRDLYVGINAAGREDNDKGYPLRFLSTLRKLRQTLPEVKLSFHAGEVDEPNYHVRDTLLLGVDRIGHGLNLITDPSTMLLMRHNQYLVEINLISNLKLNYVTSYDQHPFPEYLRTGIPVALSTDDRGMWDSNMTDEFFVAVKEFGLTWQEIIKLSENSIQYGFLSATEKASLLDKYKSNMNAFTTKYINKKEVDITLIKTGHFICSTYAVCINDNDS
jgi:adenosine deaminase CECR1